MFSLVHLTIVILYNYNCIVDSLKVYCTWQNITNYHMDTRVSLEYTPRKVHTNYIRDPSGPYWWRHFSHLFVQMASEACASRKTIVLPLGNKSHIFAPPYKILNTFCVISIAPTLILNIKRHVHLETVTHLAKMSNTDSTHLMADANQCSNI